jgi:hypothetical protein
VAARVETAAGGGFVVREFRSCPRNTLVGFLVIETPSGLVLRDVTLHEKGDARWISMPAKQYEKDGAKSWIPYIEFATKESREKFQACALAAVDAYMEGTNK